MRILPACRGAERGTDSGANSPLGCPSSLTYSFLVVVFSFQATKLKKEQENLLKQQWELENLEEERKQMEEHRKKKELGYEIERSLFQQGLDRIRSYGSVLRNSPCGTRGVFQIAAGGCKYLVSDGSTQNSP